MGEHVKDPNSRKYKEKRRFGKVLYSEGSSLEEIAKIVSVSIATVKRWHKNDGWERKELERRQLEQAIVEEADKALLEALRAYKKNPGKDLQSLNSMLKSFLERKKPDKKINDYIILFCEVLVDFCVDTGNEDLRKGFQEVLTDFAEYTRRRYA